MTEELRLKEIKKEVEEGHGLPRGYLDDIVVDFKTMNWNSNFWTRGALPFFTPEQKRLFSHAMAVPEYDNRVFMAGRPYFCSSSLDAGGPSKWDDSSK